jgi:serine/threonine-protein kinase
LIPSPDESLDERSARRIGMVFGGKFRIEAVIGAGGMATVYRAVHRNGHRVAIKVLHPELSSHGDVRARFVREAYIANSIDHPGVVRVLDDDVAEDGSAFLVMTLLEGETLRARATRRGDRLPCREVLALGREILDVLVAAHARGVVHRDIKPENVFLTTDLELKVLDFGIARTDDNPDALATRDGARLGTPAFMAPEQAMGRRDEVDARSDVWSVGATLFTLLSGRFVHDAVSGTELMIRAATQPARSLADVEPEAPVSVVALIDRALRLARDERWPSASAMKVAIEQAYESLYGEAPVRSALGPPPSPSVLLGAGDHTTVLADSDPGLARNPATAPTADNSVEVVRPTPADTGTPILTSVPLPSVSPAPASPLPAPLPRRRKPTLLLLLTVIVAAACLLAVRLRPHSPPPSEPVAAVHGCSTNHECLAASAGKPAICRKEDGVCVALESPQCRVLAGPGDVENDATVWIGAMFPVSNPKPLHYGPISGNAIELARRDFADTSGGLPPRRAGQPKRPLAVVLCDDGDDPVRAAEHLVNDVRVPAVLGFARSKEVFDLATSLFVPKGVLALAANTSSILRDIPRAAGEHEPRLVWRVTMSADMIVPPIAAFLADVIEPELRRSPGALQASEPVRVALVRVNNPTGQSYADNFLSTLRFNGKSVAANRESFRQFLSAETFDAPNPEEATRLAADMNAFAPHVIIDGGMPAEVLVTIEQTWPAKATFRPRYVLTGPLDDPGLLSFVRDRPEVRRRIFSVDTRTDTEILAGFVMRYNEVFTPRVTPVSASSAPYDGFYLLAYAAAALGDQPITGRALALAIPRLLPPGDRVDVGPGGIFATLYALRDGKSVDLQGTVTTLDFNPATGDALTDFSVFCVAPGSKDQLPAPVESGLVYRGGASRVEGVLRCP